MIQRQQEPVMVLRMNGSSSGAGNNHMILWKSGGHGVDVDLGFQTFFTAMGT